MALPQQYITREQYLKLENENDFKSEYINGRMIAMAGGSREHNLIMASLTGLMYAALLGKPCMPSSAEQRIWTPSDNYLYADLVVYCDEGKFSGQELLDPIVIFEVLSPSTELTDRGAKLVAYRKIESLIHYVLISQTEPRVEVYTKQPTGLWMAMEQTDGDLALPAIDASIPIAGLYDRVKF